MFLALVLRVLDVSYFTRQNVYTHAALLNYWHRMHILDHNNTTHHNAFSKKNELPHTYHTTTLVSETELYSRRWWQSICISNRDLYTYQNSWSSPTGNILSGCFAHTITMRKLWSNAPYFHVSYDHSKRDGCTRTPTNSTGPQLIVPFTSTINIH